MPYPRSGRAVRDLQSLRIGYVPCTASLQAPADRRRFCYYAARRNLHFEIARYTETYDVVILTQAADISMWSRYLRERGRIVFDFVDSYLSIPRSDLKGVFRGVAKFAMGQNRKLLLNYRRALERMCGRADAVICSTQDQRQRILPFCRKVYPILDFHGTVAVACKQNYSTDGVFHLVWEGLPVNLCHLLEIKGALEQLQKTRRFAIHAITDLEYGRYLNGRLLRRATLEDARKIWPGMYLYAWNERTFSAIARNGDMALIPIPLHDPLAAGKPENRLLLFWRMGIPALVSSTRAHRDAMTDSGINMACSNQQDWVAAMQYYISDERARGDAGRRGRAFAEEKHNEEQGLARWDEVLRSVLDGGATGYVSEARAEDRGEAKTMEGFPFPSDGNEFDPAAEPAIGMMNSPNAKSIAISQRG